MHSVWILLVACVVAAPAWSVDDSFLIYTEHPRIFLRANRLRLLKRERERTSQRWNQFEALMAGKAPMPERAFADALYYRASGDQEAGRRAVQWALGPGRDLRQLAIVFDWCQDLLAEPQAKALAARLEKGLADSEADTSVPAVRSRVLAAVALAGHSPQVSAAALERTVHQWWEAGVVPALKSGRDPIPRDDYYALFEILHTVRDNLNTDLRDPVPFYFKDLPVHHLLAYYPPSYPGGENEFRIQAARAAGEPDLNRAALARAADLAMVAYDLNSPGGQVLQGWLMHDRFLLRGPFGIPYEFLWANPYQPGLSYYHVPLVFHDPHFGRLFVRSTWDDDAAWLGAFDGQVQLVKDGRVTPLNPALTSGPMSLTEAVVFFGASARKFKVLLKKDEEVFVLGLKPGQLYQIEVDHEEMREESADRGGILPLDVPHGKEVGVRLSEAKH